jgi:leader peptidase (prepilin peptidase)/N-methyltransferase
MEEIILIGVFGLIWGSFLNVVIYRLPRDLSLVRPPSSCPHCGKRIKFYENIPILSYAVLRGKCSNCQAPISPVYPLVEALTALCFFLGYLQYSLSPHFFASCVFASALIALVLALVYAFFRKDLSVTQALLGAAVGGGFLLFVYGAYYLLRKKEGLGLGDVTMMLMVGAFLGWKQTILTLILASFGGAIVGIFIILFKKKDLQHALPFGTFLAPAAFVALLYGQRIIDAYLSLFRQP